MNYVKSYIYNSSILKQWLINIILNLENLPQDNQYCILYLLQFNRDVLLLKYNPTEEESEKITNKSLKLIRKYVATESLPI